ncbi:MAG: GIY-YIG nuclease family protein [Saprospiraceae bacterium]|nr:GIY-YIG nuclease family protein [Saprospiraceae bacterium]
MKRLLVKFDYRFIYVLGNTRYLFRYKIGIAKSVENRTRSIESSLRGTTYEIFAARFFFARRIEQFLHTVYSPLNARMKGSGKTEWFWMILPVTPTVFLMVLWIVQWCLIPSIVACLAYLVLHGAQF